MPNSTYRECKPHDIPCLEPGEISRANIQHDNLGSLTIDGDRFTISLIRAQDIRQAAEMLLEHLRDGVPEESGIKLSNAQHLYRVLSDYLCSYVRHDLPALDQKEELIGKLEAIVSACKEQYPTFSDKVEPVANAVRVAAEKATSLAVEKIRKLTGGKVCEFLKNPRLVQTCPSVPAEESA